MEFDQNAMYTAIKAMLVKRGYLSKQDADAGDWSLHAQASWEAYATNVYGLANQPVPWNEQSIPEQLSADEEFKFGEQEKATVPAPASTPVSAPAPAPAPTPVNPPVLTDSLSEDTDASDVSDEEKQ